MVPSPKFQDHAVGLPDEVSVNVTDCALTGDDGEKLKAAVGGLETGDIGEVETVFTAVHPAIPSAAIDGTSNQTSLLAGMSYLAKAQQNTFNPLADD